MFDAPVAVTTVLMFATVGVAVMMGFPLAFTVGGTGLIFGLLFWGPGSLPSLWFKMYGMVTEYVLLAAPLFIFMGLMVERSGIAERLFGALYVWFGPVRGGLAVATVLLGTLLAAAVGIIGASVVMLGLVATGAMVTRGYDKALASGAVCAGGTLGILIPPSVMLVMYGPTASISVGKLFMGAFGPGFLLSALYVSYIVIRCALNPKLGPPVPVEERGVPLTAKLRMLVTSIIPCLALIFSVLGVIFLGIAAPTEAAAVGALAATLLAIAYRSLTLRTLWETALHAARVTSMALFVGIGAAMFTGVFLGLGNGAFVESVLVSVPGGRWGAFAVIMFILFILGMFIDWLGIVFIMVPIVTPVAATLGFDPVWFAIMVCVNLQMSFLTPPFAYALFYLRGICRPEWGITTMHIIRGVIPFVLLIVVGLVLCIVFPDIILWLPGQMVR